MIDSPEIKAITITRYIGYDGQHYDTPKEAARSIVQAEIMRFLESLDVYWRETDVTDVCAALLKNSKKFAELFARYEATK